MLTILLLVLTAAPIATLPAPKAISADGRVTTPEGIRFRLPLRFAYRAEPTDAGTAYAAEAADPGRVVAVTAARSDTELPCEASQEGATVRPYRTEHGLRACVVSGAAPDGSGAMTLAFVKGGEVLVTVVAVAASGSSDDLARAVADSVEIDVRSASRAASLRVVNVPKAEPRLVGCFEQTFGMSGFGRISRVWWVRCFREDLTFTETSNVGLSTTYGDMYGNHAGSTTRTGEGGERRGTWLYADGVLTMAYDDGAEAEWQVELSDSSSSVLASGKLWERQ